MRTLDQKNTTKKEAFKLLIKSKYFFDLLNTTINVLLTVQSLKKRLFK